jgi:hypothetical protein
MTDKQKLKSLVNQTSKSFDKTSLTNAAQTAVDAQVNAKVSQAGAIVNEVNGGVKSLTSKVDKFQDASAKLKGVTTEGLLDAGSASIENLKTDAVNAVKSKISGAFAAKVDITFVLDSDGIAIPDTSSLDVTGGISGTVAAILQAITGLGKGLPDPSDLAGDLTKKVMDASPAGLLQAGTDLTGKIGAFTSTTINSLATDAVSSVTDELTTLVGSVTDHNLSVTLPSTMDNDSTSPTFGEFTTATFTSSRPTGDSEFSSAIKNVKTDPLASLSNVITKAQEIKQNLVGGANDFKTLSGSETASGDEIISSTQNQQTLRNRYQAQVDQKNSLVQSRLANGGETGIISSLSIDTLTDINKRLKAFAPRLPRNEYSRVIKLSQGNSQDVSLCIDLLNQSTGKDSQTIRTFLKTIDTTITNATRGEISTQVFDEPYVIGSFAKSWSNGKNDPIFPYVSSVEELQAELRNVRRDITEVVCHWTETPTNKNIGSEEINDLHLDQGLNGIGYHYIIRRDGSIQRGRPVNIEGEHASTGIVNNHNRYSIAVCFVGGINVPSETINLTQYISVQSLTRSQFNSFDHFCRAFYNVWPGGQVLGHSDIDNLTNDPGFDVRAYVKANFDKDSKFETPITRGPFTVDEINA